MRALFGESMQNSSRARLPGIVVACMAVLFVLCLSGADGCATRSDHEVAERRYLEAFERARADPRQMAYPELLEPARALFEPRGVSLDFSQTVVSREGTEIRTEGTIWYFDGKIFVEHKGVPPEQAMVFGTYDDELLGWRGEGREVVGYSRYPGDTVDLLWYLVDVSALKASQYFIYLQRPSEFEVSSSGSSKRLRVRRPGSRVQEISVLSAPLWLEEVVYGTADSESGQLRRSGERPRAVDRLPSRFAERPAGLDVLRTGETIRVELEYL